MWTLHTQIIVLDCVNLQFERHLGGRIMKTLKYALAGCAAMALGTAGPVLSNVVGDTITLGSSISLTGKYATNGLHTQRGYDYAVDVINKAGGVKVGGKSYKLAVKYYDDESTPARGAQLAERLIQQDGIEYMLGVTTMYARRMSTRQG